MEQIGDLVLEGIFFHQKPYSVHGRIALRGLEMPLDLSFSGQPAPDLCGRNFIFSIPGNDRPPTAEDTQRAETFAARQIGAVGEMTAARWSPSTADLPHDPQSPVVQQGLVLEWFSQNGQVRLEAPTALIRFFKDFAEVAPPEEDEGEDEAELAAFQAPPTEPWAAFPADPSEEGAEGGEGDPLQELQRSLDASNAERDEAIAGKLPIENEFEFSEIYEPSNGSTGAGTVGDLFIDLDLPGADSELTEQEAEAAFKRAVAEMARFGIALHLCKHATMRSAYRYLVTEVAESELHIPKRLPPLFGTCNYDTGDACEQCEREIEEDYRDFGRSE